MTIHFDDALPSLASVIRAELGKAELEGGVILRDTTGRLAFFARNELAAETIARVSHRIGEALGVFAREDRCVVNPSDFGSQSILTDETQFVVESSGDRLRLVDRRLSGVDWLRQPSVVAPPPPRFVFASVKGGVGRSTALAVIAAHRARKGGRVLAIDLDMEAPGIGAMLLPEGTRPRFGTIDALAEGLLRPLDESFYVDLVGAASVGGHSGKIDVIPAFGQASVDNPADVLAKLSRAYSEAISPNGEVLSIMDRVKSIIDHYSDPNRYDVILVDARAGLHETTASSVIGLGAEVFLFGVDEPQTFQAYAALLSHLARFVGAGDLAPEWLDRMTGVHAKASAALTDREVFSERWRDLIERSGLVRRPAAVPFVPLPAEPLGDVPWKDDVHDADLILDEPAILRKPLAILEDSTFRSFDPLSKAAVFEEHVYRAVFGDLLDAVDAALDGVGESAQ
jgi:MinD-like ATPase involved in chromosome partitioning or flagellar assembly